MAKRGPKPNGPKATQAAGAVRRPLLGASPARALPDHGDDPRLVLPETEAEWRDLLMELPRYDPFRGQDKHGFWFDHEAAARVIRFFHEWLTHAEGALGGMPFLTERWQKSWLANLYGWKNADGWRRFRKCFGFVPRKNGKSPFAAGLVLYGVFEDDEFGATVYSAAADREQAAVVYRHANAMAKGEPRILDRALIHEGVNTRAIHYPDTNSVYKVLSSEAKTKHGGNPHMVVIDELHAFDDRELVDVLETSMASANRRQSLLVFITTSDYDRPSICNEVYEKACKVRDGVLDLPSFLPAVWEAEPEDDWKDEATWKKANPNFGVSVSPEFLREACLEAQAVPEKENAFKRLHLNMKTQQDVRWLPVERWDTCSGLEDGETPEAWRQRAIEASRGRACIIGLDLSAKVDLTACVELYPPCADDPAWMVIPWFWCPEERERDPRNADTYRRFSLHGFLDVSEGNEVDLGAVRDRITEINTRALVLGCGYDEWGALEMGQHLRGMGIDMVVVRQGTKSLSEPMKKIEALAHPGKMQHGGNPVLRWMVSNVTVVSDTNGNIKPVKKRSGGKIDGVVALATAMARALAMDLSESTWSYDDGLPGV